jgi:predicted dehydrogenase
VRAIPRVALIGAGQMGALHARVLSQSLSCRFVRLIEQRPEVGKPVAERYDVAWTPELDDLSDIDAVVIAAATESHYRLAKQVMELNKPLLVEKPLTPSYEQSTELVRESAQRDLPLVCGFLERFNPAIITAKQFLNEVVQVNAIRHSPFVPRIRTGVATDLLIHDVDLTIGFIGQEPTVVKGSFGFFHEASRENDSEDSADTTMTFPSGALATISASRISQRKVRQVSVLEVDRLIEIDLLRRDITIYRHVADSLANQGVGYQQQTIIEIPTILQSSEPLAAQLQHFLNLLESEDKKAITAEREAILPAHRVIAQATASAATPVG